MALTVGELVAFLRLDDSDYQAKTTRATSTWNSLGSTMQSGAQTMAAALGVAAAGAAGLALSLAKTGASYNILQQNSRAALTAIMGGAEQANAQMDKLDQFATSSPFSKSVFITAQQQLLGFGMQAEKVLPTLDAIQQAVAATGGSSQQVADLAFVLAQVSAAGKVTATDLMQLGQRGVDAATIVGEQMGKTGTEIRDMITRGDLTVNDFLDNLTTGMSDKFAGATANVKAQWSGAADRIKAASRDIGARIAEPFIDPQGGGQAVIWGNRVADVLRVAQGKVDTLMTVVEGRMGPGFASVTANLDRLRDAVGSIDVGNLVAGWDRLKVYTPIFGALTGAVTGLNAGLLAGVPVIGRFTGMLNPMVLGLAGVIAASPKARAAVADFAAALAPAGTDLAQAGVKAADLAMTLLDDLTPGFAAVLEAVARVIVAMSPLAPAFVDVLTGVEPLVDVAVSLVSALAGLPTPVLAAAAAMLAFSKAVPAQAIMTGVATAATKVGSALVNVGLTAAGAAQEGMSAYRAGLSATTSVMAGVSYAAAPAKAALSGLVGAINPMGVAVAAVTVAVGLWAAAQARAEDRARKLQQVSSDLRNTLDEVTAATTEATRTQLRNEIVNSGIKTSLEALGLSYDDLTDAALGQAQAQEKLNRVLGEHYAQAVDRNGVKNQAMKEAVEDVSLSYDMYSTAVSKAKRAQEQSNDVNDAAARSADNLADSLRDAKRAQDDLASANMSHTEQLGHRAELLEKVTEATAKYGTQVAGADGLFSTQTESGREYNDILTSLSTTYHDLTDSMKATGASGDDLRQAMTEQRAEFVATAMSMGATEEQATALADSYGLIPETVQTDAELNVSAALQSSDELVAEINTKTGQVTVNGNTLPGQTTLGELIGNIDSTDGTVTINGDKIPATTTLTDYVGLVNNSDGTVSIKGDPTQAKYTTDQLKISIDRTTGTVTVNALDNATPTLTNIKAAVNAIPWLKTITINTIQTGRSVSSIMEKADGGYVGPGAASHTYAANGLTTRQAMFAPGGSWITWAEDETQGEYYIPAAWSKRRRSTAILADAAANFGLALVPKSAKTYANGNDTAGAVSAGAGVDDIATALGRVMRGARLSLDAGGRELTAYVSEVADGRIIEASRG